VGVTGIVEIMRTVGAVERERSRSVVVGIGIEDGIETVAVSGIETGIGIGTTIEDDDPIPETVTQDSIEVGVDSRADSRMLIRMIGVDPTLDAQ